eukprot:4572854-Amphidinium_carterae.1
MCRRRAYTSRHTHTHPLSSECGGLNSSTVQEGVAADRFEGMALRSQMVAALERAVAAAAQHAEKCAE